jgi:hypothetical protein
MSGQQLPHDDAPRRFLAAASALTPASRRDWGRAMLAELDQVTGRRSRWLYALGAAYAALLPPRSSRRAAIVLAAIAVAAALAIHSEVPQAGMVALVAVPGLPALFAWAALARPRPSGSPSPAGHAVQIIAAAAIIACPVLGVRLLTLYPGYSGVTNVFGQMALVLFGAEIAVFLLLVIRRPEPLGAGRHSGLLALAAALAFSGVYVYSRLHSHSGPGLLSPFSGADIEAVLGAVAAPFVAGTLTSLAGAIRRDGFERCLRLGAAEAVWAVLLSGPAAFIVYVLTVTRAAVSLQAADPGLIGLARLRGAASVPAWVASNDLGQAILLITLFSIVTAVVFLMARFGFYSPGPDLLPAPPATVPPTSGELPVPCSPSFGPASGSAP